METLRRNLKRRLERATRVAVLAVGSDLRGDDAAGLLAAEELETRRASAALRAEVRVLFGHTAPESLTGEIRRFNPSHVIILDALDSGRKAGDLVLVDPGAPTHDPSGATHRMPFRVLANYLKSSLDVDIFILGIQPAHCDFGKPPTASVRRAAAAAATLIIESLA